MTIRVAWTLYCAGEDSSRNLEAAREHVLLSLPDNVHADQAEELAEHFTKDFLSRRKNGNYRREEVETCGVEPQFRWRDRLLDALDGVGEIVFRLVYGDKLHLEQVGQIISMDPVILSSSQAGIRGALRSILEAEGVSLAHSEVRQIDLLLNRLALLAAPDCDGGGEILRSDKRSHVERCARCSRGLRLIRANRVAPSDLMPPQDSWAAPRTSVIALHFHPDARDKRPGVLAALDGRALMADDDLLLIDPDHVPRLSDHLWELAQHSKPTKFQLRGALVRGPGRWSEGALLGPVAEAAIEKTRSQSWGSIESIPELPDPLPEPPSPTRWWLAALLFTLLAILGGVLALKTPDRIAKYPLSVEFRLKEERVIARFDTHDQAHLAIVSQGLQGLQVEHISQAKSDKGSLGTGTGDYQIAVHNQGSAVRLLLVSNPVMLLELQELLGIASGAPAPLEELAALIENRYPEADVKLQPSLY